MKIRTLAVLMPTFSLLAAAAELPVRTVVLYKHGVGFFEREGQLGPGESARLDFQAGEMNDVLKSLTVNDQGGKVTGLRYDSSVPLSQKLTDFPFAIQSGASLSAIIDQFKGARIEMDLGTQKTSGAIVSSRLIPGDKDRAEREQLTLLLDSGELRNIDPGSHSHSLHRSEAAATVQRLSGSPYRRALQRQAQRLHRFDRFESARHARRVHHADAGMEIELPAVVR